MALADIPGYGAYIEKRRMNEAAPLAELQQVGAVQGLLAKMQAQKKAQQYEAELAKLGPDATTEQLVQLSGRFVGPEKALEVGQRARDREATVAATREATAARVEAARQAAADRRDMAKQMIDFRYDQLSQQAANEDQKRLIEQRRVEEKAIADRRHDETMRMMGQLKQPPAPVAVVGPDGKPTFVSRADAIGKTPAATEKPLTEFQGRNVLFGTRAAQSHKILMSLEDKISLPGMALANKLPGGNYVMSSEQRRVKQAQRDFVNAVLRQESGAVISDAEFANAEKQYFPAPGDDAATIAQKRANRQLAIKGFARLAGPGGQDVQTVIEEPLMPGGAVPPPPPGFQLDSQ